MGRFFFLRSFLVLVFTLLLGGCSLFGDDAVSYGAGGPLTSSPNEFLPQDPADYVLDSAVQEYLRLANAPLSSRYDFTRVDLDGDRRRDALVMMKGPHGYWCNIDGCSLIVFKAADDYFQWSSQIFPVRGPLYVSDTISEGWKNLIIRVTGQMDQDARDVAMQFNGHRYPENPLTQPPAPAQIALATRSLRLFP